MKIHPIRFWYLLAWTIALIVLHQILISVVAHGGQMESIMALQGTLMDFTLILSLLLIRVLIVFVLLPLWPAFLMFHLAQKYIET